MLKQKKYLVLGLGFFALLFGAGNLLFPPILGIQAGNYWWISITGFIISDAVFAFLAISLFSRFGSLQAFGEPLGNNFMKIYSTIVILIFGVFIIPRTASMSYEISIQPFVNSDFNSWYFYIIYFALTLLFTLRTSKVFDTLGSIFAPILTVTILAIIIAGIIQITPNYGPTPSVGKAFGDGFVSGYQTADLLGALFQASFAVTVLNMQGITSHKDRQTILFKAGIVCIIMFMILYYGLAFLGARLGSNVDPNITPVQALQYVAHVSLGRFGDMFLGFTAFITCFTTGLGILGIISNFLSDHLIKRVKYSTWAILFAIISVFIAHQGVEYILKIAGPILQAVYPIMLCYIFMQTFGVRNYKLIRTTSFTALVFSIIDTLSSIGIDSAKNIVDMIPLGNSGFVWLIPSIIAFIIGFSIKKTIKQPEKK